MSDSVSIERGMQGKIAIAVKVYGNLKDDNTLIDRSLDAAEYAMTQADERLNK